MAMSEHQHLFAGCVGVTLQSPVQLLQQHAVCLQILRVPGGVSEQEEVQVQVTRLLVESYFDVVRKNLQDAVPKAVMHFLVNSVQRGLQQHLIRSLYR